MSTSNAPCAACKFLRRKCTQECPFAPYFPPEDPQKFQDVHRVYGASNVAKLLNGVPIDQREGIVNSLTFEARARLRNPILGVAGFVEFLRQRVEQFKLDLHIAKKELANCIGPTTAMLPAVLPTHGYWPAQHNWDPSSMIAYNMDMPVMGVPTHNGQLGIPEPQYHQQQQQFLHQRQQMQMYEAQQRQIQMGKTQRQQMQMDEAQQGDLSEDTGLG